MGILGSASQTNERVFNTFLSVVNANETNENKRGIFLLLFLVHTYVSRKSIETQIIHRQLRYATIMEDSGTQERFREQKISSKYDFLHVCFTEKQE